MNKESYLFDRIRWGAAIFLIFHISLLFILFLQDWKTEKMKWFILFLGVLYVILLYAAYQLIYRPLKVNSRIKAAFARGVCEQTLLLPLSLQNGSQLQYPHYQRFLLPLAGQAGPPHKISVSFL